jgi:hypothetical protein
MRAIRAWVLSSVAIVLAALSTPAMSQQPKTFKNDQFDPDIAVAAGQIAGISLAVQPGFAQGEAFGSVFRPQPADYPVRILGLDMVLAGPPNMAGQSQANALIEFWSIATGPTPASLLWSVSTADLFDPISGQTGIPLMGNVAWSVDFDYSDPQNHPPPIASDNLAVIIRFQDAARDMAAEWGTYQCTVIPGLTCGCQEVAPILDQASTSQANLMHTLASGCSGAASVWNWANSLGVTGDFIIRLRTEVGGGCTPACAARCCGDDGCGGTCPDTCGAGTHCDLGTCACVPDTACAAGERRCVGDTAEVCAGGSWQTLIDCAASGQVCLDGACVVCVNGQLRCVGNTVEVCAGGAWQTLIDCASSGQVCFEGACAACEDGQTRCLGELAQLCVSHAWQDLVDCGALGQTCAGGACQAVCTPDCTGRECGDDGCAGSCGECTGAGEVCVEATGQCAACVPDCAGRICGPDPVCGASCGECTPPEACGADGQCACTPDCTGRECGDDGCGGACGACQAEAVCLDFACVPSPSSGCGCGRQAEDGQDLAGLLAGLALLGLARRRRPRA